MAQKYDKEEKYVPMKVGYYEVQVEISLFRCLSSRHKDCPSRKG